MVVHAQGTGGLGPFFHPPLTSSPIPAFDQMTRIKKIFSKKHTQLLENG